MANRGYKHGTPITEETIEEIKMHRKRLGLDQDGKYVKNNYVIVHEHLVGSALIGAGSNIVGGIFGAPAQSSANKTNLQIARENNAANQQLQKDQNEIKSGIISQARKVCEAVMVGSIF